MPTYGSLFAGIGGIDLGLERAGFECKWQVEFDPQCQGILARHWPDVARYGDVTEVKGEDLEQVDVLVGGWPCQDLSVAGKRAGLGGRRSGLFFEFMRLVDELSPQWILAENVPGLLSAGCKPKCDGGCIPTHGGAMGTVVGSLADRGYGFAWRVLDAQYLGLAQRRKRVFLVGHLGEPFSRAGEVLFEPESLLGDPPARIKKGAVAAPGTPGRTRGDDRDGRGAGVVAALSANGVGVAGPDDNQAQAGHIIAPEVSGTLGGGSGKRGWSDDLDRAGAFIGHPPVARALTAPHHGLRYDFESESLAFSIYPEHGQGTIIQATEVEVAPALTATAEANSTDRGTRIVERTFRKVHRASSPEDYESWKEDEIGNTLNLNDVGTRDTHAIVQSFAENQRAEVRTSDISPQLTTGGGKPGQGYSAVHERGLVRRLTPTECERLQGFPDGWTTLDANGKVMADSVRYRMLGNAVAVPCSEWIGHRLYTIIEKNKEGA